MAFEQIVGQERAKVQAEAWLASGRLPHAVLLCGPRGTGKRQMALELAKAVNCRGEGPAPCGSCSSCRKVEALNHPDVHSLMPLPPQRNKKAAGDLRQSLLEYLRDKRELPRGSVNIARENIRVLQRDMTYAPAESVWKVGLVFEAESMHPAGANSLLKILEEPPGHAIFILVSSAPERLLPTVLSRCQRLVFKRLGEDQVRRWLQQEGLEGDRLELALQLGGGRVQRALQMVGDELDEVRRQAEEFLQAGLAGKDGVYWALVEEWGSSGARQQVEIFLEILCTYMRDLFLLNQGRDQAAVHRDRGPVLGELAGSLSVEQIEGLALEVERAFQSLHRNVNLRLVLTDCWRLLRRCGAALQRR